MPDADISEVALASVSVAAGDAAFWRAPSAAAGAARHLNILHLLSQTHLTGAEVYAASLCREQMAEGHHCIIASGTLTVTTGARVVRMPLHRRAWGARLANIVRVIRLCRREHIDIIHAHSRAASWVANVVRWFVPVTLVSTVHGRQGVHKNKTGSDVYGRRIIAVCEHLSDHLRSELHIDGRKITVIRNGIPHDFLDR